MRRRRFVGTVVYFLVLAQVLLPGLGCGRDSTSHGVRSAPGGIGGGALAGMNLGEVVFRVVRAQLAASPERAQEKVTALEARHDEFVAAINATLTADSLQQLGPTLRSVLQLVDDGTLPAMTDNIAQILEMVLAEPDQKTIKALAALQNTRSVVPAGDTREFAARLVNYREIEQLFEAIAELIRLNDGVDDSGQPNGEQDLVREVLDVASRKLKEFGQPPATAPASTPQGGGATGGLLAGIGDELLKHAPLRGTSSFGVPAWVARVDVQGNPQVAVDPVTRSLYSPFMDRDRNLVADVDADGYPVDAAGARIEIAPFDHQGLRDSDGRALAQDGNTLFVYVDAKQTLLAHFLSLGGEALRRDYGSQVADILTVVLGAQVTNDNGTPLDPSDDFQGYAADNPVPDLLYGGLETFKYPHSPKVCRAVSALADRDPRKAEQMLLGLGKVLEKLRPVSLQGSQAPDPQSRLLTDQLVALFDQVFETGTGRLLIDVIHRIGQSARDLPAELALMARYRTIVRDPSTGRVDLSRSVPVDYNAAPGTFNRSVLHQLCDLVAHADQCRTFIFFGKPLAETVLDLMASQTPQTVAQLSAAIQGLKPLVSIYCPSIANDIDAIDGLVQSGALDAFLPIARAFKDKGRIDLLKNILITLQRSYVTVLRPSEPTMYEVLASGGVEHIFDVLAIATQVRDPVTNEACSDILADAIGDLVDDDRVVLDRRGRRVQSLLHLLVNPLRAMEDRLAAAGQLTALSDLIYNVTNLVVERRVNDNGTPGFAGDDYEELTQPSIVPFVARVLDLVSRNLPATSSARISYVTQQQQDSVRFFLGRDFAAIVRLLDALKRAPGSDAIRVAVMNLLTPNANPQDDVFGSLLKLASVALQTRVDSAPLRDIAAFLGAVIDPAANRIVPLVNGLMALMRAQAGRAGLQLLRNYLNPAPAGAGLLPGQSPAEVIGSILEDVRAAGNGGQRTGAASVQEIESGIRGIVNFVRDDTSGLAYIFDVIRGRRR
ncbi:MAG: hypothetical protein L0206_21670 [Actinobacteria bacterium]|nr:hypothetical protein [Actinomycetota bacterium]